MDNNASTARVGASIRRATEADVKDIARLFDEYRAFYGAVRDLPGAVAFLQARVRRGESAIFVAVPDHPSSAPVGFVQLYPSFTSVGMRRLEIVNDLFVMADWRRSGVARRLLAAAIAYARDVGAAKVALSTAPTNAAAIALYLSVGFREEVGFQRMELPVVSPVVSPVGPT
jgi:ribosomal protein S18 acetylase RimI-like enzyme